MNPNRERLLRQVRAEIDDALEAGTLHLMPGVDVTRLAEETVNRLLSEPPSDPSPPPGGNVLTPVRSRWTQRAETAAHTRSEGGTGERWVVERSEETELVKALLERRR